MADVNARAHRAFARAQGQTQALGLGSRSRLVGKPLHQFPRLDRASLRNQRSGVDLGHVQQCVEHAFQGIVGLP